MIKNTLPLKRKDTILHRDVDGHIFLIDDVNEKIHALDPIASAVWRLVDQPMDTKGIVSVFQEAFPDRPKGTVRKEITKFTDELFRKQLLCEA